MVNAKRLLSLLMIFLLAVSAAPALAEPETVTITLLETCDMHGSIASYDYSVDAPTNGTGLSRVATLVKAERENDPELLLIDCGDSIQGNMISLFNGDRVHPMVNAMNLMGYDAWVMGNHEFNYEFDMLSRAITSFEGDVLLANAYNADGTRWQAPWAIYDVKGVKVGVFGVTAPYVPQWEAAAPEHFNGMSFTSPMEETGKIVAELRDQVDVLIGAAHYGRYDEHGGQGMYEVAEAYPEVDAFIIGHSHEAFAETLENGVAIMEPGANGSNVCKLTVTLQKDEAGYTVIDKVPELLVTEGIEEDAELLWAMSYVHQASVREANTVVGYVSADFLPSLYWNDLPGIPAAQMQDTALMDLINEVQTRYSGADVSLAALFTANSNLTAGDYKMKDAVNVYKYDNTLMAVKVTGKQLKAIMEQQAGNYFNQYQPGDVTVSFNPGIRLYNYDMFSGVNYDIDVSKPAGERIVNLTWRGEPLSEDQVLVLALNNHRYGGLVSSGLLRAEDLVFDSSIDLADTPAVRDLISVYAKEKGELAPMCDNNWKVIGADLSDPDAEAIYQMVRDGLIEIPVSEDGRTPNVKSLNANEIRALGLLDKAA